MTEKVRSSLSSWSSWREALQEEEVQRLKLALRRLASIGEEDAELFLLFLPPLSSGDSSAIARLAAAAVVATIEVSTKETFAASFWRDHDSVGSVSRNLQYRLALVFSHDCFERTTSLASVLADLEFQADPDEVAGLVLGSPEVMNRFRIVFRDLALRIEDRTPYQGEIESLRLVRRRLREEAVNLEEPGRREEPARREYPAVSARLNAAIAAVIGARAPMEAAWKIWKVPQVLVLAAAAAFGHVNGERVWAAFRAEGPCLVPPEETPRVSLRKPTTRSNPIGVKMES